MKHLTMVVLLLLPVALSAQQESKTSLGVLRGALTPPPAPLVREGAQAQAPTPPPPSYPRRRGSMVGYIEDNSLTSQIRLRFDAGWHNTGPDRAEFFYAKCGCYRQLASVPSLYDPDAAGPAPGVATDLNFQQLYLKGQLAVMDRAAVFVEVPFRFIQPKSFDPNAPPGTFGNQSGLSDVRAGAKVALATTPMATLVAQVQGFFKTGESKKGLGTNHNSIEPALLLALRPTDQFGIESQVAYLAPLDGSPGVPTAIDDKFSGGVFSYGIGPSYELVNNESLSFTPILELVGWHLTGGFRTDLTCTPVPACDESGVNIVNLKVGARATFNEGMSVYVGYGRGLTDAKWYRDIFRAEVRREF